MDEDIWKLMSRCIFKEAAEEEVQQLQQILHNHPALQQQYDLLSQVLKHQRPTALQHDDQYELQALNLLNKAEKMRRQTDLQRPVKKIRYGLVAACIAAIVAAAAMVFYSLPAKKQEQKMAAITRNGERKTVVLPDGTKVWLNAGSTLHYLPAFGAATREVKLQGEAFFDVAKDTARPFVVHAEHLLIKALGTAFNVKAYNEDGAVATALYRGLVSITRDEEGQNNQPILLYPHQKIIVPAAVPTPEKPAALQKELPAVTVEFLDSTEAEPARAETSWMYNRLEFRGDDFVTLAHKMQHWFNVPIHFKNERVKGLRFNGSFEKETIHQAMKALQLAHSFNYKIKNNEVFIDAVP